MRKFILIVGLATLLAGCCGGSDFEPSVNQIQAKNLRYGHIAEIQVTGKFMRHDMLADTGSCLNPSFSASSSPDLVTLNCQVTGTGPVKITFKSANGALLIEDTLTVLPPQVTLTTSKGNMVLELDPNAAPLTVNNFLTHVSTDFYAGTLFDRVIAGYAVFGKVEQGMEVADAIAALPTSTLNGVADAITLMHHLS